MVAQEDFFKKFFELCVLSSGKGQRQFSLSLQYNPPPYNQFGRNEHPAKKIGSFLRARITDSNVKKFSYNEYPLRANSFFCILVCDICIMFKKFEECTQVKSCRNGYAYRYSITILHTSN